MSFTVMRPARRPSSSTTGSFSILWRWRTRSASSSEVPSGTVTSSSPVITSRTARSGSLSNSRSRLVMIPTTRPSSPTTGRPLMEYSSRSAVAFPSDASGPTVIGSRIIALSARFTRSTWERCDSTDMFLWMIPIPPSRAAAMAISNSVTVSMAADTTGMASRMPRVNCEETSTSAGCTSARRGTSRTSSKVRASRMESGLMGIRLTGGGRLGCL